MIQKICTNCKVEKPLSGFFKMKTGRFGVRPSCKTCCALQSKKWRKANPEKVKNRKKVYYWANTEKMRIKNRLYSKIYYEKNPESEWSL